MKFIVLNGSPKGDISVTMQYVHYIEKHYKEHEFNIINISEKINKIERNEKFFKEIIDEVASSDGVIWAFPLYYCLVASQYKRFIELIYERKASAAFKGKYAAILATSIHFSDHTAINYMNAVCDDLDMKFVDYFSPHMHDLTKEHERKNLLHFAENYFNAVKNKRITFKNYNPIEYSPVQYKTENSYEKINTLGKKIVIVTDSLENKNLASMIEQFRSNFSETIELIKLQDIDIKGGCLGCLRCGYDYHCAYEGKDGYKDFYNSKLKTADIIIFAGEIKDRYLSATWKKFFDRSFFNTHTPTLSGKQFGFIIAGALRQLPNLKEIMDIYTQWQNSNAAGFVTDEDESSKEIDEQLYSLAKRLIRFSELNYSRPITYLGLGGIKIFRDEIWGPIRFPFVADHKAYKKRGIYDFPQKNLKSRLMNFVMMMIVKIPSIRKEIYTNQIKSNMIQDLKKIVEG